MSDASNLDGGEQGEQGEQKEEIFFDVTRRRSKIMEEAASSTTNTAMSKRELTSTYIEEVCSDLKQQLTLYHGYLEILEEIQKFPDKDIDIPEVETDGKMGAGDFVASLSAELHRRVLGVLSDIKQYGAKSRSAAARMCLDEAMYNDVCEVGLFSSKSARVRQVIESRRETQDTIHQPLEKFRNIMESMFTGRGKERTRVLFENYPGLARDVAFAYNDFILEEGKREEMVDDVGEDVVDGMEDILPEVDPIEDMSESQMEDLPDSVIESLKGESSEPDIRLTSERTVDDPDNADYVK